MSPKDESPNDQRENNQRAEERVVTYSVKDVLPPNPDVKLVFQGLLWFIFHGTDECQIGIHNTTQGSSTPHIHPHDLEIQIWTITGCGTAQINCGTPQRVRIGNPKTIEGIQIDVNNPTPNSRGVFVYQRGSFNRLEPASDPRDWRWVLDFENPPLYNRAIRLKPETVNPVITVNHALFYTLYKTTTQFNLLPGAGTPIPIGNVPEYLAGNIYLQQTGDVTLTIHRSFPHQPQVLPPLKWTAGTCYQIDITNDCFNNSQRCRFEPDSTNKKERNDFYLYYDCFNESLEYELKRIAPATAAPLPPDVCFEAHKRAPDHIRSNNDSPCGAVGAGRGGGGGR